MLRVGWMRGLRWWKGVEGNDELVTSLLPTRKRGTRVVEYRSSQLESREKCYVKAGCS